MNLQLSLYLESLSQESLSTIEKFSYLTRHLEEPDAEVMLRMRRTCARGFSLRSKNYVEARKLLEEG